MITKQKLWRFVPYFLQGLFLLITATAASVFLAVLIFSFIVPIDTPPNTARGTGAFVCPRNELLDHYTTYYCSLIEKSSGSVAFAFLATVIVLLSPLSFLLLASSGLAALPSILIDLFVIGYSALIGYLIAKRKYDYDKSIYPFVVIWLVTFACFFLMIGWAFFAGSKY